MFYYLCSLKEIKIGNSLRLCIGSINSNKVPLAYFMVQTSKEKAIKSACSKTKSFFPPWHDWYILATSYVKRIKCYKFFDQMYLRNVLNTCEILKYVCILYKMTLTI